MALFVRNAYFRCGRKAVRIDKTCSSVRNLLTAKSVVGNGYNSTQIESVTARVFVHVGF